MIPTSITSAIPNPLGLFQWMRPSVRWQFGSDEAQGLLQTNGLFHIDQVFELVKNSIHSHKGRAVSPLQLTGENGEKVEAYVKLHWGRQRLVPRMTEVKTGQVYRNLPTLEWQGIERLESLGLMVPERLALVRSGRLWFREAVIIRRVPPQTSLDEMIRSGQWNALTKHQQGAILEGMVGVMQTIHQAGLGWRGTCTRHFFPVRSADGQWNLWLIDCEGIHPHLTQRAINRDYRKLHRALEISGANLRTLQWFQKLVDLAKQNRNPPNPRQPRKRFALKPHPAFEPST